MQRYPKSTSKRQLAAWKDAPSVRMITFDCSNREPAPAPLVTSRGPTVMLNCRRTSRLKPRPSKTSGIGLQHGRVGLFVGSETKTRLETRRCPYGEGLVFYDE